MYYENNTMNNSINNNENNKNCFNKISHAGYPDCSSDFNFTEKSLLNNDLSKNNNDNFIEYKNHEYISNDSISTSYNSDKEVLNNDSIEINNNYIDIKINFIETLNKIISNEELQKNYTSKLSDNHIKIIKNIIILNHDFLENFELYLEQVQFINERDLNIFIIYFIKTLYKILYSKNFIIYRSNYKNCRTILKFLFEVLITDIKNLYNKLELIINFNILVDIKIEFIQNY
jgi:hypothetical protein